MCIAFRQSLAQLLLRWSFLPLKVAFFSLNPLEASFDDRRMISDTGVGLEHGEN